MVCNLTIKIVVRCLVWQFIKYEIVINKKNR